MERRSPQYAHIAFTLMSGILLVGGIGACGVEEAVSPYESDESEASNRSNQPSGETIVRWNENALVVLVPPPPVPSPPTVLTRRLAIVHLAMHDAANAVRARYETCVPERTFTKPPSAPSTPTCGSPRHALAPLDDPDANPALAAAVAAHDALVALVPEHTAALDGMLVEDLDRESSATRRQRSVEIGGTAAQALLEARANDVPTVVVPYAPGTEPGNYQPTAPTVLHPHWRFVAPFGIASPDAFRPGPPHALESRDYATDFNETKTLGGKVSTDRTQIVRTPDQTHAAKFWIENPPINFNRAAQGLATAQRLDLWDTARTFAVAQVAFADAIISVWDTKFHYDFWRPITAIRFADDDGNDETEADPDWVPLNTTPPFPEYSAAHAVVARAAAVVLDNAFGDAGFTMTTSTAERIPDAPPGSEAAGLTRTFADFGDAARDGANSRIYGGFHFRRSTDGGLENGKLIGKYLDANLLRRR